jgi:hypothetical protein
MYALETKRDNAYRPGNQVGVDVNINRSHRRNKLMNHGILQGCNIHRSVSNVLLQQRNG